MHPPSCCVGGSDVTGRQRQTHVPICRVSRYFSWSSLGKLDWSCDIRSMKTKTAETDRQTDSMRPRPAAAGDSTHLTFVPSLRQRQNGVVDQRKLLVLPNQDPINKGSVVTVVLHKDLTALLHTHTHTQSLDIAKDPGEPLRGEEDSPCRS